MADSSLSSSSTVSSSSLSLLPPAPVATPVRPSLREVVASALATSPFEIRSSSSSSSASGSSTSSSSSTATFSETLLRDSSLDGVDIQKFWAHVRATFAQPWILNADMDISGFVGAILPIVRLWPTLPVGTLLPTLRAVVKDAHGNSGVFGPQVGLLIMLDDCLRHVAKDGDGWITEIDFRPPMTFLDLEHLIFRARQHLAYADLLRPRSTFQKWVADEAATPSATREALSLVVFGAPLFEVQSHVPPSFDEDRLRKAILLALQTRNVLYISCFFDSGGDPSRPTLDEICATCRRLHRAGALPFAAVPPTSAQTLMPALQPSAALSTSASVPSSLPSVSAIQAGDAAGSARMVPRQNGRPVYRPPRKTITRSDANDRPRRKNRDSVPRSRPIQGPRYNFRPRRGPSQSDARPEAGAPAPFNGPSGPRPWSEYYTLLEGLVARGRDADIADWLEKVNSLLRGGPEFISPFAAAKSLVKAGDDPSAKELLTDLRKMVPASSRGLESFPKTYRPSAASSRPPRFPTAASAASSSVSAVDAPASDASAVSSLASFEPSVPARSF